MNNHPDRAPAGRPYRPTHRSRSTAVGLVLITLVLLVVGGTRWFLDRGFVIGVTPTVTPTARKVANTPTVDFRATQNAEEVAFQSALQPSPGAPIATPAPVDTDTPMPTPTDTPTLMGVPPDPSPLSTESVISLPIIGSAGGNPTPTSPSLITTPTTDTGTIATETPIFTDVAPVDSTPTDVVPTDIASGLVTMTPTATATPAQPTQSTVQLQAFVQGLAAPVHVGPSSLYTKTADIPSGQRVILQGRDAIGEWIYLCCELNIEGWTYQANLAIRDNPLPTSAPPNSTPDDVRWLPERQASIVSLTPVPVTTPIPAGDFPLFRGNRAAQARIDQTFLSSFRLDWSDVARASSVFSSPVIVSGSSVLVASDDLELYSFEKSTGRQRWREKFDQVIRFAAAVQGQFVYVVDSAGTVHALLDQGSSVDRVWSTNLGTSPRSAVNIHSDILFIAGADNRLYMLNRFNGAQIRAIETTGGNLQYPVIGNQLVYVGNNSLRAIDVFSGQLVWEDSTHLTSVSAPPVYSQPGVLTLAEIYVADAGGSIIALDANTARHLWTYTGGERVELLALDNSTVYAAGQGYVKAILRTNGTLRWRREFDPNERLVGGPIIGQGRLIFATANGTTRILDAFGGEIVTGVNIPTGIGGQPAASDRRLFIPGIDGILYAFLEDN